MNKYLGNKPALALFLLPALILYSVILIYPVLQTVLRSFYDWDGLSTPTFSGLSNYRELFSDPLLANSLKNGLIFAIVLAVFQIGLGTLLALICADPRTRGRKNTENGLFYPGGSICNRGMPAVDRNLRPDPRSDQPAVRSLEYPISAKLAELSDNIDHCHRLR
nr:hypothetical protein [Paenibacillus sp. RC343]